MSLDGPYDRENVFARILRGELPTTKVYENDHVIAIMDLFPQSRGHCLVLPKVPCRNLFDVPADALKETIAAVQTVANAVRDALSPDGVSIFQFNGAAGGQTVFHLHFHIVPRFEGEPMKGHGQAGMADAEELKAIAEQIRAAF